MLNSTLLLSVFILSCAALNIGVDLKGQTLLKYVTKPSVMLGVLLLAVLTPGDPSYKWPVLLGLIFSLAGDIFLMLPKEPKDYFLAGLISFLLAHLSFMVGLTAQGDIFQHAVPWFGLFPFLLYALSIVVILWPHLKRALKIPVLIYAVTIGVMGWTALAHWWLGGSVLALVAGLLFIASDTILALNRFYLPIKHAQIWILGTYFPSQWLFALSIQSS